MTSYPLVWGIYYTVVRIRVKQPVFLYIQYVYISLYIYIRIDNGEGHGLTALEREREREIMESKRAFFMAHMKTTYPKDTPQVKEGRLQQNLQQHVHPELRRQVPLGHPQKRGSFWDGKHGRFTYIWLVK